MNQDDIKQLSPEILAKFIDWGKRFDQLSLSPWDNLEELKKLRDDVAEFVVAIPDHFLANQFDAYINQYTQSHALMEKIFNCIIRQCMLMK